MNNDQESDLVLLETELFGNAETLLSAMSNTDDNRIEHVKLVPAQMKDADWDELIQLVLNANKVITL